MPTLILVGIGGFAGAIARYLLAGAVGRWAPGWPVPLGTLFVNVAGCFIIGFLTVFARQRGWLLGPTRLLLGVGFLGSFTTFSTFGQETVTLLQGGPAGAALANIMLQLGLGFGAVVAGQAVGNWLPAAG